MKLIHLLIILLLIACLGVLIFPSLSAATLSEVIIRIGEHDYITTVPKLILLELVVLLVLWGAWQLISAPFQFWGRYRRKRSRAQLVEGFNNLNRGYWSKAEKQLLSAIKDKDSQVGNIALVGAIHAAQARSDEESIATHLKKLAERDFISYALIQSERLLTQDKPAEALNLLDTAAVRDTLPPRGLLLRAKALMANLQANEAYGLLGALKKHDALSAEERNALEAELAKKALQQIDDDNTLAEFWDALPKALRRQPSITAAYAQRATALKWDEAAIRSIEQSLDKQWDESLITLYGQLPLEHYDSRRASAQRWLKQYPNSPALLLTLARLARHQNQWEQAQDFLQRALAQNAGIAAWKELGDGFTQAQNPELASLSYSNISKLESGQPVNALPQLEQDQHNNETRNDHGFPQLPAS